MNDPVPRQWGRSALVRTVAVQAAAAVVLLLAASGADGRRTLDAQIPWLDLAVVASLVAALAQVAWLVHGRRAVSVLRRQVLSALPAAAPPDRHRIESVGVTGLVVAGGAVHDAGCLLARGKRAEPAPAGAVARCLVCGTGER